MKKWLGAMTALGMALTVAACGSSGGGAKAAPATGDTPSATPLGDSGGVSNDGVSPALWAKWGLKPLLPAPAAPGDKPVKLARTGKVPVITHIPTTDKVVFITMDDGAEKDPKFAQLMQDLKIPITMFLTRDIIKNNYGFFKPLQALGNHIQNHTVSHPPMNTISLAAQKQQICGDQKTLTSVYGTAPYLFRPPYGAGGYTTSLNEAVQACGPRAIILWKETMQITGFQYQAADKKLRPGDIILAHFRGPSELKGETEVAMFVNMVKRIEEQGFSVARLEDYIAPPAG